LLVLRILFGVGGARYIALLRGIVGIFMFGIQTFFIAKSLGYSASVGALQANFGTPQETGILDLQNTIAQLNGIIESNPIEIENLQTTLNSLNFEIQTLTANFASTSTNINNQLTELEAQKNVIGITEEEIIQTVEFTINDLSVELSNATTSLPTVEAELQTTIDEVNIGNREDSGWTSVNLDTNGDGTIDENDIVQ